MQINSNVDVFGTSILGVTSIQILNLFNQYAPSVVTFLQIVIAVITIFHLIKKLKKS